MLSVNPQAFCDTQAGKNKAAGLRAEKGYYWPQGLPQGGLNNFCNYALLMNSTKRIEYREKVHSGGWSGKIAHKC